MSDPYSFQDTTPGQPTVNVQIDPNLLRDTSAAAPPTPYAQPAAPLDAAGIRNYIAANQNVPSLHPTTDTGGSFVEGLGRGVAAEVAGWGGAIPGVGRYFDELGRRVSRPNAGWAETIGEYAGHVAPWFVMPELGVGRAAIAGITKGAELAPSLGRLAGYVTSPRGQAVTRAAGQGAAAGFLQQPRDDDPLYLHRLDQALLGGLGGGILGRITGRNLPTTAAATRGGGIDWSRMRGPEPPPEPPPAGGPPPSEPPPAGATPAEPPPISEWQRANRAAAVQAAIQTGRIDQIERMARSGRTADQIAKDIGWDINDVRAVRDHLGIEPAGPLTSLAMPGLSNIERGATSENVPPAAGQYWPPGTPRPSAPGEELPNPLRAPRPGTEAADAYLRDIEDPVNIRDIQERRPFEFGRGAVERSTVDLASADPRELAKALINQDPQNLRAAILAPRLGLNLEDTGRLLNDLWREGWISANFRGRRNRPSSYAVGRRMEEARTAAPPVQVPTGAEPQVPPPYRGPGIPEQPAAPPAPPAPPPPPTGRMGPAARPQYGPEAQLLRKSGFSPMEVDVMTKMIEYFRTLKQGQRPVASVIDQIAMPLISITSPTGGVYWQNLHKWRLARYAWEMFQRFRGPDFPGSTVGRTQYSPRSGALGVTLSSLLNRLNP